MKIHFRPQLFNIFDAHFKAIGIADYFFGGHMSLCGTTDTSVFDFW